MQALIRKADGVLDQIVASTKGYNLKLYDVVEVPEGVLPHDLIWDGKDLVQRPMKPVELAREAVASDPLFEKLRASSPDDLGNWIEANVQDMADVRRVLKFVLLSAGVLQTADRSIAAVATAQRSMSASKENPR